MTLTFTHNRAQKSLPENEIANWNHAFEALDGAERMLSGHSDLNSHIKLPPSSEVAEANHVNRQLHRARQYIEAAENVVTHTQAKQEIHKAMQLIQ